MDYQREASPYTTAYACPTYLALQLVVRGGQAGRTPGWGVAGMVEALETRCAAKDRNSDECVVSKKPQHDTPSLACLEP